MKTLHSIQENIMGDKAIFEIELPNRDNVFMSVSEDSLKKYHVVIVEAQSFLELWRNDPGNIHSEISHGDIQSWENDHKYKYAEQGFSHGIDNPVPLAKVAFNTDVEKKPVYEQKFFFFKKLERVEREIIEYVSFIDGITRTIWLLSKGAKYFPLKCISGGQELARVTGYKDDPIKSINQIFIDT
ncbi:plasmid fertility inhibition factor family protein [Fodinibius salsisoli]|uniref:Uncharacterized protein n=1 Tax=Fodinibius salsisoli TaxID=2820877 RepID=A0ABT3PIM4_9BACT|nr:hypothetical protein [Fodinibius salsisoli]MCW9705780.1 hypothetical protein [Fodinibius salsisoli]